MATNEQNVKNTNEEILQAVIDEVAKGPAVSSYTDGEGQAAAMLMQTRATGSPILPGTALYNAATGLLAKIVMTNLETATYRDVYARHHRGEVAGGDIELGFVEPATAGTGNDHVGLAGSSSATGATGASVTYTSVTTADTPALKQYYKRWAAQRIKRLPITPADVKTAFASETGISDYLARCREALTNAITDEGNVDYDALFLAAAQGAVAAGAGTPVDANFGTATYEVVTGVPSHGLASWSTEASRLTEAQLLEILVKIKAAAMKMIGRPNTRYTATGVANNAERAGDVVVYINSDVYAYASKVTAFAYNIDQLRQEGVDVQPMTAPWIDASVTAGNVIALVCSVDFARDWITVDDSQTQPIDSGVILTRRMTNIMAVCGYEPAVYIVTDNTAAGTPTRLSLAATWQSALQPTTQIYGTKRTSTGDSTFITLGGDASIIHSNVVAAYLHYSAVTAGKRLSITGSAAGSPIYLSLTATAPQTYDLTPYMTGGTVTIAVVDA